jgi:hypothetical protein
MITDTQRKHFETAVSYVASRREKKEKSADKTWSVNRGDLMILVMLIDQELQAESPITDPKRLAAIREKLGDLVYDAPEMSKEEAQIFR